MDAEVTKLDSRRERLVAREELRRQWIESGWYSDLTIGEALGAGARAHPADRIVFEQADGSVVDLTLAELLSRGDAIARRLGAVSIGVGTPVVVQTAADAAGTEVIVALWRLGAVVVPVVTTAGPAEVAHVVAETGARVMIVASAWRDVDLASAAASHRLDWGLNTVLVLGADDAPAGATRLIDIDPAEPTAARAEPSSVACVLYTSGSTGVPKGVQHSHETLLAGFERAIDAGEARTLTPFPAGHVASVIGLLRPFASGGMTVVMDRWSARRAADVIEKFRITSSSGTPFYLATLLDEADRSGRDISSLSRFLVGAATVPPALVARAEALGIVTWRTYGSTEHPAISGGSPDHAPEKRRTTDGVVGPGNEVRLVDEHGNDVESGEEGEILARGPRQFLGYRDHTLDDEAFVDGSWFRTGDQGRLDADSHLIITGRVKEIIIRGGENISAREVEDVLAEHGAVDEVAVCPVADPTWGEVVGAFVRFRPGRSVDLDQLRTFAATVGLAAHKLPARLVVVEEFPRTAAGKVRKRDLRSLS